MPPDRIVRDHTVINAGAGCASFRRTDDAEVGAAIELGAKTACKGEAASSKRDQSGGQIKRGGDRIVPVLDAIAKERGTSRMVVALSWLLKHPSKIIPIVGSTNPERIREALKAADLELTREEWYRLLLAGRGEPLP